MASVRLEAKLNRRKIFSPHSAAGRAFGAIGGILPFRPHSNDLALSGRG
jgi:hypothetical protein